MSELENLELAVSNLKDTVDRKCKFNNWFYQKILEIMVICLLIANLYFQFFDSTHSFSANIRNISVMPDSTYVEVVYFNDGDFDELIKKVGFYFVTPTRTLTDTYWMKNTVVKEGQRNMFELKYQTYSNRNIWELGLNETNASVDVYFYMITMDSKNIEDTLRVKIGDLNNNFIFTDYTPIILDIINPNKTIRLDTTTRKFNNFFK